MKFQTFGSNGYFRPKLAWIPCTTLKVRFSGLYSCTLGTLMVKNDKVAQLGWIEEVFLCFSLKILRILQDSNLILLLNNVDKSKKIVAFISLKFKTGQMFLFSKPSEFSF